MGFMTCLLYLDQNYLSGIAKRKPAFQALEPVLHAAVAASVAAVVESDVHERESGPRPDLGLLDLPRELPGGRRLPSGLCRASRELRRRMAWTIAHELPERRARTSDAAALDALASAIRHCDLVTSRRSWLTCCAARVWTDATGASSSAAGARTC